MGQRTDEVMAFRGIGVYELPMQKWHERAEVSLQELVVPLMSPVHCSVQGCAQKTVTQWTMDGNNCGYDGG